MADKIFSITRPLIRTTLPTIVIRRTRNDAILIRPNLENSFNVQINAELLACYTYLAMANHFGRQRVSLPGCKAFYAEQVKEEQSHARKLMDYVSRRGGRVVLHPLPQPIRQEWPSPLSSFKESLEMELDITQKLLNLYEECQACCDLFACNLIENEFLDDQVESVDKITRFITEIERMGTDGLATHIFDQYLLKQYTHNHHS